MFPLNVCRWHISAVFRQNCYFYNTMNRSKKTIALALLLLPALSQVPGQIEAGGEPRSFRLKSSAEASLVELPPPTPEELAPDEVPGPYRLAVGRETEIDVLRDGKWESLPGEGRICRLKIRFKGANAIHLFFSGYSLPGGADLFIYNEHRTVVMGAFTSRNNKTTGKLSIRPVRGDVLTLEYFEPEGIGGNAILRIGNVGYNHRGGILEETGGFGDSERCNKDINCTQGDNWQLEKRSVCRIVYKKSDGQWYLCSGALINNARNDGSPYFLSANHCVSSNTEAESMVLYFNYESPTCKGPEGPDDQTVSGAAIVATTYRLDFSMVELSEEPPLNYNPYYAGWDAREQEPGPVVSIHHPAGDVKKISSYNKSPVTDDFTYLYDYDDFTHWYIDDWTLGITEGGSSGSPLFNSEGRIVGDLTGGSPNSNCTSCDAYYAKFSDSWADYPQSLATHLKPWLDPDSTGILYLDGHDPLNPAGASSRVNSAIPEVFPNPADDYIMFRSGGDPVDGIELIDITGRVLLRIVMEAGKQTERLELQPWWKGVYFLRIHQGEETRTEKVIIR